MNAVPGHFWIYDHPIVTKYNCYSFKYKERTMPKRLKKHYVSQIPDIPNNWREKLLILWQEDDAPVSDKERLPSAFQRIVGRPLHSEQIIYKVDDGDVIYNFHRGGWVAIVSYQGGEVGVLVKEVGE